MNTPMFVETLLSELTRITNGFCDLVLGPLPQKTNWLGEILEVHASEPEKLEKYIKDLLSEKKAQAIALLGVEVERWKGGGAQTVLAMPAENAAQMLYAAQELIKSEAIDLIVMQDLLLRPDYSHHIVAELRKLKTQVGNSNVTLVLLNPDTSERKMILSELEIVCSRQIPL